MTADPNSLLPDVFQGSWLKFVESWCGGHSPGYGKDLSVLALRTVHELWPESISPNSRGLYPVCGLIELGRLLHLVRTNRGFDELLHRLRLKDQGAHAELIAAGSLINAGFQVELNAPCEGHHLDLCIEDTSMPVYVEVTAPEVSVDLEAQRRLTLELGIQLDALSKGFSVFVEFLEDVTPQLVNRLLSVIEGETSGTWQAIEKVVRFRREPTSPEARVLEVQWPDIDHRAERIVRRKCGQLSRNVPNVLIIDMSRISGSIPEWLNSIATLLQPNKNRRIGAVAVFQSLFSAHLDRGYRLWRVVENPYALHRIPESVLNAIRDFDQTYLVRRHSSA